MVKAYKVIGIEKIDYTKKDGTEVHAVQFHLSCPAEAPSKGEITSQVYVSAAAYERLTCRPDLGALVYPIRNSKGFLEDFLPASGK